MNHANDGEYIAKQLSRATMRVCSSLIPASISNDEVPSLLAKREIIANALLIQISPRIKCKIKKKILKCQKIYKKNMPQSDKKRRTTSFVAQQL